MAKITLNKKLKNAKDKFVDSINYQKHFSYELRQKIEKFIADNRDKDGKLTIYLKDIGRALQNDSSTISKEVKNKRKRRDRREYDSFERYNSICEHYKECTEIDRFEGNRALYKKKITHCINRCKKYKEKVCVHLAKFPWTCNGCPKIGGCNLNKFFYYSDTAHQEYKKVLSDSREGISVPEDEFRKWDKIISRQIIEKKQPIAHIYEMYKDSIPFSLRSLYQYIEINAMSVKNIDLRRKVTYRQRNTRTIPRSTLKAIKTNRSYEDYVKYLNANPDVSVVEMDTVEGNKGEQLLLTLHFKKYSFQLAYIIPNKQLPNVSNVFHRLLEILGSEDYSTLFEVILTDNGSEFANPEDIEFNPETGEKLCSVFFCHPLSPTEKGACEKNHEYIRYFFPKGKSISSLTDESVNLMMSHINNTHRPKQKATPYQLMELTFGREILDKLGIKHIRPIDVVLDSKILK